MVGSYGLFANTVRRHNLIQGSELLHAPKKTSDAIAANNDSVGCTYICKSCEPMLIIEILHPDHPPRAPPL